MSELDNTQTQNLACILKLGRALQLCGSPAHRFEEAMTLVAKRLGMKVQVFGLPTGFFFSIGEGGDTTTHVQRVMLGDTNLRATDRVYSVVRELLTGDLDAEGALMRLDKVLDSRPRFPQVVTILCFGLAAFSASIILGGGYLDLAVASIVGLLVGLLKQSIGGHRQWGALYLPIAAIAASVLSQLLGHFFPGFSPDLTTLAGLVPLLPGLTLTTAMNEMASGSLVSGTARSAGALMVLLQLAFGVALGQRIVTMMFTVQGVPVFAALPASATFIALLLAPIAYTVLMQGRFRDLWRLWLIGFVTLVGTKLGAHFLGSEYGLGLGALMAGLGSNLFERLRHRPALVLLLPTLLLLTPGSVGFKSFSFFAERDVLLGMDSAFRLVFLVLALVTGLLLANVALPPTKVSDLEVDA